MYTITVTNLNDSGIGSLRQAILDANSYTGTEDVEILFDASLAGGVLTLSSSLPSFSSVCSVNAAGIQISGSSITTSAALVLNNIALPQLILQSAGSVDGENITLTSQEAIRISNWSSSADFSGFLASAAGAYVGLYGSFGDTTLAALPASFAGGYKMMDSVRVKSGATVTLAEGVCIGRTGSSQFLYIHGTLEARNKEVADALTATQDRTFTYVKNGGKLLLENANVNLGGWNSYLDVQGGGTLEMSGGSLSSWGGLSTWSNGAASLVGVEVKSSVSNEGSTELEGTTHTAGITNSGTLEMQGVTSTSYVQNTGSLTARNVTLGGYLDSRGTAALENVSCTKLYVDSVGDVVTTGTGVTMTSDEVFRLYDFSGGVDELLDSMVWTATSTGDKYIGLYGSFGDTTLNALPLSFAGGYKMTGSVTVKSGATVTLAEGVCIGRTGSSQDLYINGTLEARNKEVADALTATQDWTDTYVQNGGKLLLENANVNLGGWAGEFQVQGGGTLEMSGGSLYSWAGLSTWSNGVARLVGVEVKSSVSNRGSTELEGTTHTAGIINSGTLAMQGVTSTSYVQNTGSLTARNVTLGGYLDSRGTAALENVSCTKLYVYSVGDVVTTGTGVTMTSDEVFLLYDFSGGVDELLDSMVWTATSTGDKYIGLYGSFGDTTLSALPLSFAGGYKMTGSVTVKSGATVTLAEGVCIGRTGWGQCLYINGTLEARNKEVADALTATQDRASTYVQNGGKLLLENANVNLGGWAGYFQVQGGGTLEMSGGSLYSWGGLSTWSNGVARLVGVEVKSSVSNGGSTELEGTTHTAGITNSGTLAMQGVTSTSSVQNTGSLTARNVTLGGCLDSRGTAALENVSCATLYVYSVGDVVTTGTGVTMTSDEVFRLYDFSGGVDELLDSMVWTATSTGDKYIGLYGSFGDTTLNALPLSFAGGYKMTGSVTVKSGATVTLAEGVCIGRTGSWQELDINGTLEARNKEVADALTATQDWTFTYVQNGGKLLLENANVNLGGWGSYLYVQGGGTLEMSGGSLYSWGGLSTRTNGAASLVGVEVKSSVSNEGRTELEGTTHTAGITNSGTLAMQGVTSTSSVQNTGSLTARNVTLGGYLDSRDTAALENVSCATLYVDSVEDVVTTGTGVTMTSDEVFRLYDFSGGVDELLDSMVWTATGTGDKYIGLDGSFGDTTLNALPLSFAGGYKMMDSVRVKSGATVTLAEGVCIGRTGSSQFLYINGTLEARNKEVADALTATQDATSTDVQNGGKLLLENANVNLGGWYSYLDVRGGGTLEMSGGSLYSWGGLRTWSNGAASLVGVEVKSSVSNEGSMSMTSCRMNNQHVTLNSGSTSTIINTAGIGRLTINRGCNVTIQGNDFSGTTIVLNNIPEGEIIDLSGNYWGTSDLEVIKSRIQGYDETRVLIATLLSEPNAQVFSFDASMLGAHRISDKAGSLVLRFNAMVDADTVSAETIRLVDEQGNALPIAGFEVAGDEVTLVLESLPQGVYSVQVGAGLQDVMGNAFSEPAGQRKVNFLSMELDAPKVIFFRSNSTVTDQFRYVDFFFDQNMETATVTADNIHIYTESGVEVNINRILQSGIQGNVFFRAYFDEVTEPGTYRIVVDSAVQTTDGRNMATDYVKEVYVASPDLEVPGLVEYTDDHLGRYTTITYNVLNSGDGEARGTWTDHIYLCKSETWDESQAVFFASVERRNQLIAPGESYSASARALLDALEPGEYYVFVKSDMASRVSEGNEFNNISATGTKVCVRATEMSVGDEVVESLASPNETMYYQITAAESATLAFSVDSEKAGVTVLSSMNGNKQVSRVIHADNYTYAYFAVEAGQTYLVAVKTAQSGTYTAQVNKSEFDVIGCSVSGLVAGYKSTMLLYGAAFADGMVVYLEDSDGNINMPVSVEVLDACTARVVLYLPEDVTPGTEYTLYAKNQAGDCVSLNSPMQVNAYSDAVELEFRKRMNGEAHTQRVGWVWKTDLTVSNVAGYDVDDAIILITDTAEDFAMYYSYDDAKIRDRSALLFLGGADSLTPEVLTAGESSKVDVYVKHYRSGTGAIQAWLLDPNSTEEITAAQWAYFESALRPSDSSDADWSAWWSDMKPRIGDTIGDFTTFIYGMRDAVSAAGQKVNVSSLADLTSIAMTHCPDYVPCHIVRGELTEWGTGNPMSGVRLNLHKKVGDSYELIGSVITDSQGCYSIRHDGEGTYYVSVPGLSVDADGDGRSDIGIPEFEIGEEDKVVSLYVVTYEEAADRLQGRSDIEYAENGDLGRLWMGNGYLSFSVQKDEEWSTPIGLRYAEGMGDTSLRWDDSLKAFVVFWNEVDETGYTDSYVQLIKRSDDGGYIALRAVQIGTDDATHTTLQSRGDGQYLLVRCSEALVSCVELDLKDERHWQKIEDEEHLLETGKPLEGSFTYPIKMPFGKYSSAEIAGFGSMDKVDPCKVQLSYELKADIAKKTWHGQYDYDTWTVSGSLSETVTYFYTELKEKAEIGSGRANLTISLDCPDGLIYWLKRLVPAVGGPLFILKNALSKFGIDFDLGYKYELKIDSTWESGKPSIIQPSFTVSIYGGVEDKKDNTWYARGSGAFTISYKLNMSDMSIVSNSFSYSGNLHYEVKTPRILGWIYESSGDLDFGQKEKDVQDISFKRTDIAKMSIVRSLQVEDTIYTITSDEQNNFSKLSITANKNGELYSVYINTSDFSCVSDLLQGRGYITDISCYTLGDYGVIVVNGYVGDYVASDNVTATELIGILDTVNYMRVSHTLYVKDEKVTDKWGGIPDEEIPEGDRIQDTKIAEADNGKQSRVDLVLQKDGKYALYYSEADDGKWGKREKVTTCERRPTCIDVTANGGKASVIYTETKFTEEDDCESHTYVWVKSGGEWKLSSVTGDDVIQTAGSTMIQTVISAIGADPWSLLKDCDKKPEDAPKPNDELPHENFQSFDPNDFYGPAAYGKDNWIVPQEMQFQILCENIPEENIAHAAMVTIKHKLDDAYDYSTFRLGDMMIGGNYIEISEDVKSYKARQDWTSTLGVWVDVNAFFDADTGEVVWEFVAIDPETGWIVSDPFKGLLAPNYNPPEGDGWVYYYVEPKETTVTGTTATSQAEIIFDFNDPIMTPVLSYTFDSDSPVAQVKALAESSSSRFLRVEWSGEDVGSGVDYYNVFVSVDGGDWSLWQGGIAAESALYTVAEGEHTYAFFAQGVDYAGNAEALPELVVAEAATVSHYAPQGSSLRVTALAAGRDGDVLTLTVGFNEPASCTDWASALQLLAPAGALDMAAGSFSYDEAMHTLTWVGSVAGVAAGEQLAVRLQDGTVSDAQGIALGDSRPAFSAAASLGAVGSAQAAPALVDYDGDGLLDLLVGEVASGKGRVRLYLNEGTAEVADFASFSYLTTAADTPLTVDAEGCQGAIVQLAELTGDAAAELVIGLADGTVRVFTAGEEGHWTDAGLLTCSVGGKEMTLDVGSRAAIEFVDFDGDGRTDLLVGEGDGHVVLYRDTAESGAASFDAGQYLHDSTGRIKVGSRASVVAADVDADGRVDLLLGSADGSILFYRNEGSAAEPLFATGVKLLSADKELDLSAETSRLRLDAADVNGDGLLDVVLGQSDGAVRVLYGSDGSSLLGVVQAGDNPLYAVENVQALAYGGQVRLSWDAVEGATYELSYKLAGDAVAQVLELEDAVAVLPLADGRYELSVRALTPEGTGPWSAPLAVLVDTVAPLSPESLQASAGENGSVSFSWTEADSATTYELRYKTVDSGSWQTLSCKATSVTLYNLPGGAYDWQVRAVDAAGNTSGWVSGAGFESTGAAAERVTWARGLSFDTTGKITGGYYDIAKTGEGDSNLCWAAAAANILGWWQQQYPTGSALAGVPQDAAAIYACFCANWANKSGSESYAFTWWLADESDSASYMNYYYQNYQGSGELGGWYADYYNVANIGNHTAQVKLADMEAADVAGEWNGIYRSGGMLALGVYRSYSSGSFAGGHSLTLWGFQEDAQGRITQIHVTDSDDEQSTLITLDVELDTASGLYRIAGEQGNVSGYYLGSYTYLKAGGMTPDGSSPEQAESLGMSSARDGSGHYSGSTLNWVGAGDAVDFFSITAAGDGAYRVGVDAATLETTLRLSVGVLNGQGLFEVQQQMLLAPGAALAGLPGVQAGQGETLYVKVEALDTASAGTGGFYELNISGTVPAAGSGLATQDNNAEEAAESSADGSATRGWVGAGDACDFYRVEMAAAGNLSIGLDELEAAARVRVYEQRADGSLAQLDSRAVKAASGLDATLSLTSGTYFVEVASLDAGAGQYNTAYSLTLEKEEQQAAEEAQKRFSNLA